MANRPRIFISSTIYDFADLRSALRHYLSSLGYDPLLSEYNDFRAPIDENSYDACTAAIESCQYFILLIGSRVGGMYDSDQNISITRHEYRIAYELLNKSKLKIISFVRQSLWNVKEDRKSLEKYLQDEWKNAKEFSDEEIEKIATHSSQFANDAEALFSFIDEVVRKEDMRKANRSGGARPIGNWIFQFDSFTDIVDALKIQLNINASIGDAAAIGNLRREIVNNLLLLLEKYNNDVSPGYVWADFLGNYNLDDFEGQTQIPSGKLLWVLMYMLTGFSKASRLADRYAHEIIKTGQLQHLDYQTGVLSPTPLGEAVLNLLDQIERLKFFDSVIGPRRVSLAEQYRPLAKSGSDELVAVPNEFLFMIRSAHDRHQDIVNLSKAIIRAIDGDDSLLTSLKLQPIAASQRMAEELKRETPSLDDLEKWVNQ